MSSRVLVSLRVRATPARAFDVFTREIGAWWRPNGLFGFTRRSPGRIHLEPGEDGLLTETYADGEVFEIGRVTAWHPGERVAFTWRQASFLTDEMTRVDVRFEPMGEETRVTVEHLGWETVRQENVARHRLPDPIFLQRHGEWWQALLGSYRTTTGTAGVPSE
jgi:hypothetical protein